MSNDEIYQNYIKMCDKLGIVPASKQVYFHETSKIIQMKVTNADYNGSVVAPY